VDYRRNWRWQFDEPVEPGSPGLEQFNHVLVFASDFHGGRLIDCTDKNSDLATTDVPLDLGGTKVLVLNPTDARLIDVPLYGDHSSRMEVSRVVRLADQTNAALDETVTPRYRHDVAALSKTPRRPGRHFAGRKAHRKPRCGSR
jgi:hypothetical protein